MSIDGAVYAALEGRPQTIERLTTRTRLARREVEGAIQSLRLAGEPIVTGNRGVHLTADPREALECAEALRRRLVAQYLTLRALRATARRMKQANDAAAGLTFWGPSPSAGSAESQRALDELNERTYGPLPAGASRDITTWVCGYCGDHGHDAEDCGDAQEASRA